MNGIWKLTADMSESEFFPETQEMLQSPGLLCESPKERDETSACSSAEQDRVCKEGRGEGKKNGEKQWRRNQKNMRDEGFSSEKRSWKCFSFKDFLGYFYLTFSEFPCRKAWSVIAEQVVLSVLHLFWAKSAEKLCPKLKQELGGTLLCSPSSGRHSPLPSPSPSREVWWLWGLLNDQALVCSFQMFLLRALEILFQTV